MNIEKIPTVRLVFDRKHVSSKTKKGLVQIEVTYKRKRKWLSANVKVYKDQWDDRKHVVNAKEMIMLNETLDEQVISLQKWIRDNLPFSWESLEAHLNKGTHTDNFMDFLANDIAGRNDIRETTRKAHKKLISILKDYGRIAYVADLTKPNILDFDNWLHGRKVRKLDKDGNEYETPMRQQSLYSYHRLMRTYIHRAIEKGLLEKDPYQGLKFSRGESEPDRFVSKAELERIMTSPMRSGSIARARDLFVFQSYTGLAYADLALFDFTKATYDNEDYLYSGKRKKTGEVFYFVILEPAMEILQKYHFKLPIVSSQGYDSNLKKVAADAKVDKPLASHWARRTAGMMLINAGIRLEVVAKILGHSSVKTTEQFYASITEQTVKEEMKKAKL